MLTEQIDLGMSGIQRHIAAGQKDHGNVEILNDLCGCRNTLVEDLLSQHIKEGHKHDCDQANTGNVRNVFQNLYNHIVDLVIQSRALFGQLLFLLYKKSYIPIKGHDKL